MPLPLEEGMDPRTWVFFGFDKVEDGPGGEKRGRLSISFVYPERDYVHFSLHPIECWWEILIPFNALPPLQPTATNTAMAAQMEDQANQRVAQNVLGGYRYLNWSAARQIRRADGDRWLAEYKDVVETLKRMTRQTTHPEVHQERFRNPFPYPFSGSRIETVRNTPLVQFWASVEEWNALHAKVQAMPDLPEMACDMVNDSLIQATEGMVRILSDDHCRQGSNDAFCPYRFNESNGIMRVIPRWIKEICELDDPEPTEEMSLD